MSTFRPPSGDKAPPLRSSSELESQFERSAVNADDIPPISSRFDKMPGPMSSRSSGLMAAIPRERSSQPGGTNPGNASSRTGRGGIYHAMKILEDRHGAFFISRLILASGINLRSYDPNTADDPVAVTKFIKTLRNMLSPADLADVLTQTPSLYFGK